MTQNTNTKNIFSHEKATFVIVDEASETQKIDNFLLKILKNVPKSHIYKILRSGEVRVNKKRVDTTYRLQIDDEVRIPPIAVEEERAPHVIEPKQQQTAWLDTNVIFEDDALLAINKPSGYAVHGGSGLNFGVIELIRHARPKAKFLELVHRIDRETSGILLIAKKRSALVNMHDMMRHNRIEKKYTMMVEGEWTDPKKTVELMLKKTFTQGGERRVNVTEDEDESQNQMSKTIFYLKKSLGPYTLLEAKLITGRTHQLRVQLAHLGFPILGDDKYGDFSLNKVLQKKGLKRMFLHALSMKMKHPLTEEPLELKAPLPRELDAFLSQQAT
ncbi:RluA Pseudouridylate synthases, 23S RNA-specific [Candidatus Methylopumilus planktonicus]|uniref:RluA family pseudouridine synthase n=1 Tax=Candidatus Methylopumilus planktonicus TaxID=1581557 RepID=UPI003BEEF692